MKSYTTLIACFILFLYGCDKGEEGEYPKNQQAIEFETVVAPSLKLATDLDTYTSTFGTGDAIGLFAVKRAGSATATLQASGNYVHNVKLTFDGTKWNAETPIYYPNDGDVLDFYAYYPYNAANTDPTNIEYDASANDGYQTDWMTARKLNVPRGNTAVQLSFVHKLAMIHIKLDREVNAPTFHYNFLTLDILNVKSKGAFDLSVNDMDDEFTIDNSFTTDIPIKRKEELEEPDACSFIAYLPEQQLAGGKTFYTEVYQGPILPVYDNIHFYYNTSPKNIKTGHVTPFNMTVGWGIDPEHVYAVGDVYPHVGPVMGIVYQISNGGKNGKAVHLQSYQLAWTSPSHNIYDAIDMNDGKENYKTIISSLGPYDSALAATHGNNGNSMNMNKIYWYPPAINELTELYDILKANETFLNSKMVDAGGSMFYFLFEKYWSSTENPSMRSQVLCVDFTDGSTISCGKSNGSQNPHFRDILSF